MTGIIKAQEWEERLVTCKRETQAQAVSPGVGIEGGV